MIQIQFLVAHSLALMYIMVPFFVQGCSFYHIHEVLLKGSWTGDVLNAHSIAVCEFLNFINKYLC